jgi:hypothetical protein
MTDFNILELPKVLESEFCSAEAQHLLTRKNHLVRLDDYMIQFKPTTIEVSCNTWKKIFFNNQLLEKYKLYKGAILEHFTYDKLGRIETHGFIKDDQSVGEWRSYNTNNNKIAAHIYFVSDGQIDLKRKSEDELFELQSKWAGPWIGDRI